ncbi:hypothetical protein TNCV_2330021 [Trichonephila clavipes]|nr:hypothetical protein TNCV_2330021 [Trichonephila clavipes]
MLFLSRLESISGERPTSFPKKIQPCLTWDSNPNPTWLQAEGHSHHTGWRLSLKVHWGCGSPVVKVSNHGRHVMSSIPVPLKTRRVGQRCTLNLSRAETSSRWIGHPHGKENLITYHPIKVFEIVALEGRFDLSTFRSKNEYLSHPTKTIVIAWRLLLVDLDITPPHYTLASDSANERYHIHGERVSNYATLSATDSYVASSWVMA